MDTIQWNLMRVFRLKMWQYISCILFFATASANVELGDIYPSTVNVAVGKPLNLTCSVNWSVAATLNTPYLEGDINYLSFHKNQTEIPRKYITKLNSSAIELYIPEMNEPFKEKYVCFLKNKKKWKGNDFGISYAEVHVGYAPQEVRNFRCISYNWEKLNCTFDKDVNYIFTNYQITAHPDLTIRGLDPQDIYPQNNYTSFTFNVDKYIPAYEYYVFDINISNSLGNLTQTFRLSTFDCIKPDPPLEMNVVVRDATRVTITWKLFHILKVFTRGFIHEGEIFRSPDPNGKSLDMSKLRNTSLTDYSLTIDGLYAHTWYDIRIRVRVPNADREELWSNYTDFQFQTRPKIPDRPPRVDIGSFYVNSHNDIVLYWEQLPLEEQNGNNSHYVVSEVRNEHNATIDCSPSEISLIKAKFQNVPPGDLTFTIKSANSQGQSKEGSEIHVPARGKRFPPPQDLKKYSIDSKYKLKWAPPATRQDELVSYTVFWCESKTNYPSECDGPMSFRTVSSSQHEYELNNTKGFNIALSANSRDSSSGLIWSMCTASKSDEIGKLNPVWVSKMDATYMEIQWRLECMDTPIVVGYTLTYCPITAPKNLTCKPGTEIVKNITGTTQYNITGLTPYTTYKTTIAMFSKTRTGVPSDPLVNTTLEAAPTPPRNIILRKVTNTSVTITWDPPERMNGFLKNYIVWCNSSNFQVFDGIKENKTLEYKIEKLQTYSYYDIVVVACTISCSNKSETINVRTEMGVPDQVTTIAKVRYDDYTLFSWDPPRHVGGHLDYYEVSVKVTETGNRTINRTILHNGTKCWINRVCEKNWVEIELLLSAVNIKESPHERRIAGSAEREVLNASDGPRALSFHNDDLPSAIRSYPSCYYESYEHYQLLKWRNADEHSVILKSTSIPLFNNNCGLSTSSPLLYIFIIFIGLIGMVTAVLFLYKKCKTMSDIKVVLPDALNDINKDSKCPKEMIDGGVLRNVQIHRGEMRVQQDEQERSLLRNHMESSSSSTTSSTANVDNQSQCESHDGPPEEMMDSIEHQEDEQTSIESHDIPTQDVTFDVLQPEKLEDIQPQIEPQTHQVALCPGVNQYVHFARPSQGYTQLAALKVPIKTPMATETDETGISGYVTRKQLADFGQRM
uniref:Putative cytokine receptor n=3 Tax=Nyssomyia neivai TaxID=330878 RepID=A0A1L8E393_9DIPT